MPRHSSDVGALFYMKYKNWDEFLVHASSIWQIMSKPPNCTDLTKNQKFTYEKLQEKRAAGELKTTDFEKFEYLKAKMLRYNDPELSKVAITHLIRRYAIDKYNKKIAATGQLRAFASKGNQLESQAIDLLSEVDGIDYIRPDKAESNGFVLGKCDAICPNGTKVIDAKVSWNSVTFLSIRNNKLKKQHWYQMQGYLWLYGLEYGEVRNVLLNTPEHLADRERLRQTERYMMGEIDSDIYDEKMEELETCFDYDSIPVRRRIITFGVYRNEEVISKIANRVKKCREFLNEFEKMHLQNKIVVTSPDDYINANSEENNTEYNPADSDS